MLTLGLALLICGADGDNANDRDLDFFERRIRPVLVQHCYECHSQKSKKLQGGLLLDSRAGIRKGGDTGPAVKPRDLEGSEILGALRYESFEMPPKGRLPDRVIDDFAKWIERGAVDPRGGDGAIRPGRKRADASHWSLQPIQRPKTPAVKNADWPRGDIDRYLLARMEAEGLRPAADADRETLIRRLYFDLVGAPPTVAETDAFVADAKPRAYERLVDRLLQSPRFGERWGRHWLDVARFAESTGGGRTRIFDDAWRYRDYVARSFNDDKPFDRFIVEQIAGDLIPAKDLRQQRDQLTGLGFLVLGPINYELQDKELLRMEVIDEQLTVIGRAFLGMTFGCARCHDHKFDPISTAEYYSLAGILHSTKSLTPGNVSGFVQRTLPLDAAEQAALDEFNRKVKPIDARLVALRDQLKNLAGNRRLEVAQLPGLAVDDTQAKLTGAWTSSASVQGFVGDHYLHDGNTGKGEKWAEYSIDIPTSGRYEVRVSHTGADNRASNAPVTVWHADGEKTILVNQKKTPPIDGRFVSLGEYRFVKGERARVKIVNAGTDGHVILDTVQWLPSGAASKTSKPKAKPVANGETQKRVGELNREIAKLEKQRKALGKQAPAQAKVMGVEDQAKPADFHVCIRGNVHNLGAKAPRGFPKLLGAASSTLISDKVSGRKELAEWIASPRNPLTGRVIVNRVWGHLFGEGLVRTPDNFGLMGQTPSHPALLDHLAVEFFARDWSIKQLIRRIVNSRAYRQQSRASDKSLKSDPENFLLSRMNRRRLDAEALRDAILSVTGRLDERRGGPTLKPKTTTEFGYSFDNVRYRRSFYVPVLRNTIYDLFDVFDIADPNRVTGRRNVSILPSQALYLLNSPYVMDRSREAASRLLLETSLIDEERVELAFRRFLGRRPSVNEKELAVRFLEPPPGERDDDEARLARWAEFCQGLIGTLDFRYVH